MFAPRRRCHATLLLVVWSVGCDSNGIAGFPTGAMRITPPAQYGAWWSLTEACSGHAGDLNAVRWYTLTTDTTFSLEGQTVNGAWYEDGNRIVIAAGALTNGALVRHEMLHALLRALGHPRAFFLGDCGDIVGCIERCVQEAGGPPDTSTSAPVVDAAALRVGVLVAPDTESAGTDGGWLTAAVTATNVAARAVRVAVPTFDGVPQTSYAIAITSQVQGGDGGDAFAQPNILFVTFAPAGTAGATRRFVFDLAQQGLFYMGPGAYQITGTFANVTGTPAAFTLTP